MSIRFESEPDKLVIIWEGDIDHHSASEYRERIDTMIETRRPKTVVLDFASVGLSDSSGIALVLGRYKLLGELGGTLEVANASPFVRRVLALAGVDKMVKFTETAVKY